jgi:polyribonucleotide nucleotidyltransferase
MAHWNRRHSRTLASVTASNSRNEEISKIASASEFSSLVFGPQIEFGFGKIACLAESSVMGSVGQTVAFATITSAPLSRDTSNKEEKLSECILNICRESSSNVPLTLDYRQRHHAVGKIPTTALRDDRRPTQAETLAGRAIDRSLRPLLKKSSDSIHLTCSIQACPLEDSLGGNAVTTALNAASVALKYRLKELVAGVYLCLLKDGRVIVDPSTKHEDAVCELLYAGTREKVVMMEFSGLLPESQLKQFTELAHDCIQPILDTIEETEVVDNVQNKLDEDAIRSQLGLAARSDGTSIDKNQNSSVEDNLPVARAIYDQALEHCKMHVREASLKTFGVANLTAEPERNGPSIDETPTIHPADGDPLLSKFVRGQREHILREEIRQLLQTFSPDSTILQHYEAMVQEHPSILSELTDSIHTAILGDALREATTKYHRRADGRGSSTKNGCVTIRPLQMEVPALPDVVHGSSIFTRGETQVLCTVTVGPPKDGILLNDPYNPPTKATQEEDGLPFQELPVGSLRYLRTQEYMLSDLNSRKIRADREQTGDSGQIKERRQAFLQYDFPAYCKGEVPQGYGGSPNRREVGHGALAERAVLPVLPGPTEFPYAIRMTSEVTSSNGSSSMASVCGATLALLDAGVPIAGPVAGVSVGLVLDKDGNTDHQLLLDITGTEDFYGAMDFKIAGTENKVTAIQLDVKEPLPLSIVFEAIDLARDGRAQMLKEMDVQTSNSSAGEISNLLPRSELKDSAPRVEVVRFDPMRKKDLLGPGGVGTYFLLCILVCSILRFLIRSWTSVIRQMEDRFNVSLDLTQEGQCLLYGEDKDMVRAAKAAVMDLVSDVEVGGVYEGTVIELRDFGAIIELLRNKEGLCHVSELADKSELRSHPHGAIGLINSLLHVGKRIQVECTAVDIVQGTIRVKPASLNSLSEDN